MQPVWCVVPAAGSGRRFGGEVPKQYRVLRGRPMLQVTLERLAAHPLVAGLVVVLAQDDPHWPGWLLCEGKPVLTAVGGAQRADSVRAGLQRLAEVVSPDAWVMVHDAARPCVRGSDITRLLELGCRHRVGAILAVPLRDTLKRSGERNEIADSVDRENLWRAMTPQLFRRGELMEALVAGLTSEKASRRLTDESSAFEMQSKYPLLVEACEDNLKVTTEDDLLLAERILSGQD